MLNVLLLSSQSYTVRLKIFVSHVKTYLPHMILIFLYFPVLHVNTERWPLMAVTIIPLFARHYEKFVNVLSIRVGEYEVILVGLMILSG